MVMALIGALLLAFAMPALAAPDLLAEAEFDAPQVHVQAQAVYRLRFLHAVDVRNVQIVGPSARLANLHMIGKDRVYEAQRGHKRYRVHERRYAAFPFASGTLALSGAYVTGRIPASTPAGWQAVRLEMPQRVLTVLPADRRADGQLWLPARALTLSEQWVASDDGSQRRTIRIQATGLDTAQLPQLDMAVPGMEVIAGTPRLDSHFMGERMVATREQTFVMVPARAGLVHVPALQLRWWNVASGTAVLATLPGRTLSAGKAQAASAVPANQPATAPVAVEATPPIMLAVPCLLVLLTLLFVLQRRTALRRAWRLRRACMAGLPLA